jgi:integrase
MSVNKKKDGRWYVAWRDPDQGGRIVYEYFGRGAENKRAAQERDLDIKKEKIERAKNPPRNVLAPTFQELAQEYVNARQTELSDKTIDHILRTVSVYAFSVIGSRPITHISMADWSAIEEKMIAREVSSRTINKYFQYLSRIFAWAVEREYIKENPWKKRKTLRIRNRFRVDLLTREEFQRIVAAADPHLKWALEVEIHTGLRPGPTELFALKWDDFNYETGELRIYSSKTDSCHSQYVSAEFLERLKQKRGEVRAEDLRLQKRRGEAELRAECPFVISFQGQPVLRLSNAWKEAKERAKITRRVRLYDIRHFYITHALASGADIMDLAHRVGHKDANMIVNVYAHLVEEMRSKRPLEMPKFDFTLEQKQDAGNDLLATDVSQNESGRQVSAATQSI